MAWFLGGPIIIFLLFFLIVFFLFLLLFLRLLLFFTACSTSLVFLNLGLLRLAAALAVLLDRKSVV